MRRRSSSRRRGSPSRGSAPSTSVDRASVTVRSPRFHVKRTCAPSVAGDDRGVACRAQFQRPMRDAYGTVRGPSHPPSTRTGSTRPDDLGARRRRRARPATERDAVHSPGPSHRCEPGDRLIGARPTNVMSRLVHASGAHRSRCTTPDVRLVARQPRPRSPAVAVARETHRSRHVSTIAERDRESATASPTHPRASATPALRRLRHACALRLLTRHRSADSATDRGWQPRCHRPHGADRCAYIQAAHVGSASGRRLARTHHVDNGALGPIAGADAFT